MSRLVHELYATGGDAAYATPTGDIVQVPSDFAFADTIIATDDELPTAPTAPITPLPPPSMRGAHITQVTEVSDPWTGMLYDTRPGSPYETHAMMHVRQAALTGPPPPAPSSSRPPQGLVTQCRSAFVRAKNELDSSRHEMQELWSATQDHDEALRLANEEDPFVRLAGHFRRVRALWSFFEWDRADLMRAAWIGVAVFVVVATVGAFALQP